MTIKSILDVNSLIAAIAGVIVAFLHMIGMNRAHGKNLHDLILHSAYAMLCCLAIVICFLAIK